MVTIADASWMSDLELQREQELAEARAIQIATGRPNSGDLTVYREMTEGRDDGWETLRGIQIDSAAALQ